MYNDHRGPLEEYDPIQHIVATSRIKFPPFLQPRNMLALSTFVFNRLDTAAFEASELYSILKRAAKLNFERFIQSQTSAALQRAVRLEEESLALRAYDVVKHHYHSIPGSVLDLAAEAVTSWSKRVQGAKANRIFSRRDG